MNTPMSKTTYYRRLRKARQLGCSIDEVPDMRGKGRHVKGSGHPRWNHGRLITHDGYILVRVGKGHPLADPNGYCREHVLVMCSAIGRALHPNELIHHKNGDKTDNRIENLELLTIREHNGRHNRTKLRAEQVVAIRTFYAEGRYTQKELALRYGVAVQTISKIIHGYKWASQGGPIMLHKRVYSYLEDY